MADKTVKIGLQISDNGSLTAVTSDAKSANAELKKLEATALSTSKTLGSIKNVSVPSTSAARAKQQSGPTNDMLDYKTTRGITGATGAASRDFAKQSQGLGGLVHVYATFAANIFAVGAAFTALKNAADTTNMVKGLDQLGAASGRNLGQLSKTVVRLTDNAVSLREAMTAVAQASSAGMSAANIERMTAGAKNVSAALGLNITDALSRLSRGISKVEPELLDELGIFVRVDKAAQDYARTLGKTASSLTDIERRTGFANAVLTQMEEKFGGLQLDANPYSKLLASLSNLTQKSLEFLNMGLTPVVKVLADNMLLLGAAIAYVGKVLLSMAIPALTQFKETQKQLADNKWAQANIKNTESIATRYKSQLKQMEAASEALSMQADTAIERLTKLKGLSTQKKVNLNDLNKDNLHDYTQKDIDQLNKYAAAADKAASNLHGTAKLRAEERSKAFKDAAKSIENYQKSWKVQEELQQKGIAGITADARAQAAAQKANIEYISRSIQAKTAQTAAEVGFFKAIKEGWAEVDKYRAKQTTKAMLPVYDQATGQQQFTKSGKPILKEQDVDIAPMTLKERAVTKLGVAYSALATRVGTALNFLGLWGAALSAVIGIGQAVDHWLSNSNKEIEAYSVSLEAITDQTRNLGKVQDQLRKSAGNSLFSAEGTQTRATAISETTSAISKMLSTLEEIDRVSNAWDRFWDKNLGTSRQQKTSKAFVDSINAMIKTAAPSEARSKFADEVQGIIGGTRDSELSIIQLNRLSDAAKVFSQTLAKAAEELNTPKKAFEELNKAFQNLSTASIPADPLSKYGIELAKVGATIEKLGPGSVAFAEELTRISKSTDDMVRLGDFGIQLSKVAPELQKMTDEYNNLSNILEIISEKRKENNKLINDELALNKNYRRKDPNNLKEFSDAYANAKIANNGLDSAEANLKGQQGAIFEARKVFLERFESIGRDTIVAGLNQFEKSFQISIAQAGLKVASALAASMDGAGGIEARAKIAQKEIDLRTQSNTIMQELILAQARNTIAVEKEVATREKSILAAKLLAEGTLSNEDWTKLTQFSKTITELEGAAKILDGGAGKFASNYKAASANKDTAGSAAVLSRFYAPLASLDAQNRSAGQEKLAIERGKELQLVEDKYKNINTILESTNNELDDQKKRISAIAVASGDVERADKALLLARDIAANKDVSIQLERTKLEEDLAIRRKDGLISEKDLTSWYNRQVELIEIKAKAQSITNANSIREAETLKYQAELTRQIYDQKISYETLVRATDRTQVSLDAKKSELDILKQIGIEETGNSVRLKASLDTQTALNNAKKEFLSQDNNRTNDIRELDKKNRESIISTGSGISDYQKQLDDINTKYSETNALIATKLETELKSIKVLSDYNAMLADQKVLMEEIASLTTTLGIVFGKVGAQIGAGVAATAKLAQNQDKFAKQKQALENKKNDPNNDAKDKLAVQKEINKLEEDAVIQQLNGMGLIAGETKKMFSEKTGMYKALNAIEQANHAASMVMQAQQMAADIAALPTKVAGGIGKLFSQGGWAGFAGAAALLAMISSLVGGIGSSTSKPASFMPDAKQKQEVQGTAMGWDSSGNKIQTSRGVFGDTEAKSDSIVQSLEIIRNNSVDGLAYDNKVVVLLSKINDGINKSAKSIYSISGIRTGSLFNTTEGTKSSGGIFGLFSTKVSTEIKDAGVVINGSFIELASDISNTAIKFYEDVLTTKKNWYGKVTSSNSRKITDVDNLTAQYFTEIFKSATAMFVDIGKGAGMLATDVVNSLAKVNFVDQTASLRGLKGDELEKELTSIVSSMLDKGAEAIFGQFEAFAQFGEGMLETVVRVTDTNAKIKQALSNININSIADTTGLASYAITEALVKWAGGLDKFLEINTAYADKFLTESEKLVPIQKAVTDEMAKLNLSGVTTREQFKKLVSALDLSIPAQQALYTRLMTVSEGFYAVTEAVDSTSTANSDRRNLEIELMRLTGRNLEAITSERIAELSALDESLRALKLEIYFRTDLAALQDKLFEVTLTQAEKLKKAREKELEATLDVLKPIVKYTQAMEDVATAKEELTKAYEKESQQLSATISKLTSASQSLKDFRNSLLSGNSSTLTPQQKYEQTRNALNANLAIANSIPTTDAERAAQEAAISKVSSLSQEFLAASQVWNASSTKYTEDFNYVLSMTGSLSDSLDQQATEAQKALDAMKAQVTSLGLVETALLSTKDAIINLTTAINTAESLKAASDKAQQFTTDFAALATSIINSTATSIVDTATGAAIDTAIAIAAASASATIMDMVNPVTTQINDYINTANAALTTVNTIAASTTAVTSTATTAAVASIYDSPSFSYSDFFGGNAIGGKATGIRLVGELGPELVDFTQPGRVYTAEQTKGMFAANDSSGGTSMAQAIQSLTREVQYLNKEVAQLRKEQNQQTGALIASNYDANQRAADTISEIVETTATETQWAERSKVKVS